jgi:hypothetical protein
LPCTHVPRQFIKKRTQTWNWVTFCSISRGLFPNYRLWLTDPITPVS